jgi:hypothetical protein
MKNMCFCLTWAEKTDCVCNSEFIMKNRDRWENFYSGNDSIELQIKADPRIIINDREYSVHKYDLVKDPDTNGFIRLMVLYPVKRLESD